MALAPHLHLLTDLVAAACGALNGCVFYRYGLKPSGYTASAQRELGYWATLSFAARSAADLVPVPYGPPTMIHTESLQR